jgi:hypothetical protein
MLTTRQVTERPVALEMVVNRWIDGEVARVTRAATRLLPGAEVPLSGGGRLTFSQACEYHDASIGAVVWSAPGRVSGGATRLTPAARVEIELASWSTPGCELLVRPRGRCLPRWGSRRRARYFRLAHDAADTLVQLLGHTTPCSSDNAELPGPS